MIKRLLNLRIWNSQWVGWCSMGKLNGLPHSLYSHRWRIHQFINQFMVYLGFFYIYISIYNIIITTNWSITIVPSIHIYIYIYIYNTICFSVYPRLTPRHLPPGPWGRFRATQTSRLHLWRPSGCDRPVPLGSFFFKQSHMAVCQNLVPLVNPKIAGKWMFIPLELIIIGFDPPPYDHKWSLELPSDIHQLQDSDIYIYIDQDFKISWYSSMISWQQQIGEHILNCLVSLWTFLIKLLLLHNASGQSWHLASTTTVPQEYASTWLLVSISSSILWLSAWVNRDNKSTIILLPLSIGS